MSQMAALRRFLLGSWAVSSVSPLPQEYVLSHTEMPGTLQAADATIKKLEDFMSTMEANGERIRGLLEAGRQLVSEGNVHAEKIQEKADSVERRYREDGGQVGGPKGNQVKTG